MSQDLRIRVRGKLRVAVTNELILEGLIIFDNAVVDKSEAASRIKMGTRVLIGRFSVGCPAGVADSVSAGWRTFSHQLAELGDAAGAFASLHLDAVHNRHPGGIVASIFQAPETIEQDGCCLGTPDVTYDAAHEESVTSSEGRRKPDGRWLRLAPARQHRLVKGMETRSPASREFGTMPAYT